MAKQYSRIAFIKKCDGKFEILLQLLDVGKMVFPGGERDKQDSNESDTAIRELIEETTVSGQVVKSIITLLKKANRIKIKWGNNEDTVFLLDWKDSFNAAQYPNQKDCEIVDMVWVPIQEILQGKYDDFVYKNIKDACSQIYDILAL